jgi:branched-chain amino acid aminotransferase
MQYAADSIVFDDGRFVKASEVRIDPFSQTLHYGNGIFDGIRAYQTVHGPRMFKARAHYERFAEAARQMALPLPYSIDELVNLSYELLDHNGLGNAYLRPLLIAAPNMSLTATQESQLMIGAFKWGKLLGDNLVHLMISDRTKPDPGTLPIESKISGLYVNNILATSEARAKGFHDSLMRDQQGYVAQGAGANLFIEKEEILYTPPKGNIMPGITRETVIEMAREMSIQVVEKNLTPEEIYEADGGFLAGTAVEITGIATVDRQSMSFYWEDTIGYQLSRKYRQRVTHGESFKWTLI